MDNQQSETTEPIATTESEKPVFLDNTDSSSLNAVWSVNWTIAAGITSKGGNAVALQSGVTLAIDISQSITGRSQLLLINRDTNTRTIIIGSGTTTGWHRNFTVSTLPYGYYHLAIENLSSKTITYTGTYHY